MLLLGLHDYRQYGLLGSQPAAVSLSEALGPTIGTAVSWRRSWTQTSQSSFGGSSFIEPLKLLMEQILITKGNHMLILEMRRQLYIILNTKTK